MTLVPDKIIHQSYLKLIYKLISSKKRAINHYDMVNRSFYFMIISLTAIHMAFYTQFEGYDQTHPAGLGA
ncbi:hypothetical protein LP2241_40049 [Pseudolactococcus piscium]|nr:hypothetical protein LP2241_40049 [Lactococcus piscium]